jgi:predicted cupin superfamily sugar epimerase
MNRRAEYWINHLKLVKHIEGGWFSEVYRSNLVFPTTHLPPAFNGPRNSCTHIYFLLEKSGFSALHRIQSDELWHFYDGDPLVVFLN